MEKSEYELYDVAERNLVQIHSFFPRIDTRVSAIFAIITGQIAVAALNLTIADLNSAPVAVSLILFSLGAIASVLNLYWCTYPNLIGGEKSLIYFGQIAKRLEEDYVQEYRHADLSTMREEVIRQIWRNSQIVQGKYEHLKVATLSTGLSIFPWAILLASLSLSAGKVSLGN